MTVKIGKPMQSIPKTVKKEVYSRILTQVLALAGAKVLPVACKDFAEARRLYIALRHYRGIVKVSIRKNIVYVSKAGK